MFKIFQLMKNKYFMCVIAAIICMAIIVYGVGHRYYCFKNDEKIICVWKGDING